MRGVWTVDGHSGVLIGLCIRAEDIQVSDISNHDSEILYHPIADDSGPAPLKWIKIICASGT